MAMTPRVDHGKTTFVDAIAGAGVFPRPARLPSPDQSIGVIAEGEPVETAQMSARRRKRVTAVHRYGERRH